jgi:hypothetical protein
MNEKLKDKIIANYEKRVNEKINNLYDVFYIQPYYYSIPTGYGVIFNGNQIALCKSLQELEQLVNTIIFFLEREG